MKGVKQPMYMLWNKGNVPYWLGEDYLTSHSLLARLFDKADEQAIIRSRTSRIHMLCEERSHYIARNHIRGYELYEWTVGPPHISHIAPRTPLTSLVAVCIACQDVFTA